jgi:hypothetical protein
METSAARRLVSTESTEVEDELLAQLGGSETFATREILPPDENCPFDLEVAAPRAVDVAKLYTLWHQEIPPTIQATLGPRFAVMLCHSLTPFYRIGRRRIGVASLGYMVTLEPQQSGCRTASLFPESKLVNFGKIDAEVQLGLDVGGELALPQEALTLANTGVPGLNIAGAKINATTNAQFGIAIHCAVSLVQVQAGPIGEGGARWNIYKAGEGMDVNHTLLQTLLVPEGTTQLHVQIDSWIREPRRFLKLFRSVEWKFPTVEYDVPLEAGPLHH